MSDRSVIDVRLAAALAAVCLVACSSAARPPAPAPAPTPAPTPAPAPARPARAAAPAGDTTHAVAQLHLGALPESAAIRALVTEGMEHSHAGADLEYLSDVIGPRLTGSAAARRASDWAARKFREYRLDSAWVESWRFGQPWERGPLTLTLLAPQTRQLMGASWAWAPGTNGPVTGNVIYVSARTPEEYAEQFAGVVRGKWVMTRPPAFVWNTDGPTMTAADSAVQDSVRRTFMTAAASPDLREFRQSLPLRLAHDGALGLIGDGGKEFGLLTMSGSPTALYPMPYVVLPHETFAQFHRLLAIGQTVTLRADIANSLGSDTVDAPNTVAQIRGATKPDEVVLLGAHLDSWDLGTGTTDNGTGAVAVLEAARILKAAGVRPARTIRFVLFTGEEEGLLGSQHYAERHAAELRKYDAVLVLDNGTGRIDGMSLQDHNELHDAWQALFAPVGALGPFTVRQRNKAGTDHLSFVPYGVPSFNYDQETRGYNHTHHSQVDTFDHAVVGDLRQAATVMAVTALELATIPEFLDRGKASIVAGSP